MPVDFAEFADLKAKAWELYVGFVSDHADDFCNPREAAVEAFHCAQTFIDYSTEQLDKTMEAPEK